ncbi:MAG: hypothetical protein CBC34_001305 [Hyphomicrobiaceae bacterium TMED74]|nr:MAG: hypothetical protein CBC34_001305 [Hyphomicrobiaceae bacterium TMED74]
MDVFDWLGNRSPALSTHLRDEAQISIVYSGVRNFQIGATTNTVAAGSFLVIPAGTPHISV